MATIEATADNECISAVVKFRHSVGILETTSHDILRIEDVIKDTDVVFEQCDNTLKEIYNKNEQSEETLIKMGDIQSNIKQKTVEVARIDGSLKLLASAEKCVTLLKEIEAHFAEKDFYRLVVKVEQLRQDLSESPYRKANIFSDLAKRSEKWRAISSDWLGACMDQCITITSTETTISCSVDQKYLKNLCKDASYDLLANVFVLFSRQLLSSMIVPILRRSVVSTSINSEVLVISLATEDLTDSPDRFDSGAESATLTVIPCVITVYKFVKEHIFIFIKNRKFYYELVARFGSQIVNDMSSLLCSIFLRPLLPNRPSRLGSFHNLVGQVAELQAYLEEAGYQPEANKFLEEFVDSHVNTVLEKYETALLVRARDLMLLDWDELTPINDSLPLNPSIPVTAKLPSRLSSDSLKDLLFGSNQHDLFALPSCQVSSLIVKFIDLVRQVFDEIKILAQHSGSGGDKEVALLSGVLRFMAPCARHVADMFLAFLPTATASLKGGPLSASAIMLCNCAYFANSLLLLEMEFASIKTSFQNCKNALPTFIFLDMVQPTRSHGWTGFRKALEQTRSQLLQVDLDAWCQGAGGKLMATGFRARCEQSLTLVVTKLAHVISSLRSILPQTLAASTLAILLDAVLAMVVSQISSRVDISDAESRVHFEMLTRFSDDLISKVGVIAAAEGSGNPATLIMGKVYLSKLCPESWPRFLDMISLLDSDLASIVTRWADGAGPLANSFAADELRTIIRALFQNSEVRQRALQSIK